MAPIAASSVQRAVRKAVRRAAWWGAPAMPCPTMPACRVTRRASPAHSRRRAPRGNANGCCMCTTRPRARNMYRSSWRRWRGRTAPRGSLSKRWCLCRWRRSRCRRRRGSSGVRPRSRRCWGWWRGWHPRGLRCCCWASRARARSWWPMPCTRAACARGVRWCLWTAPACPRRCSSPSCSGMRKGRSPARPRPGRGWWRRPTAARCFWTRWATSPCRCRSSCCACWRPAPTAAWAAPSCGMPTCAWYRPRTATCSTWWPQGAFVKTCTTA